MSEDQQQLHQTLWNIANDLSGNMDADDFRDYLLGFIFYKYLSRKMALHAKIETVTQQIEITQQFKKGLLQQMFV